MEASGQPSNDGEGYLEIFRGLIDETLLGQALKERIDASALRTEVTQLEEDIRQRMDTDIAEVTRKNRGGVKTASRSWLRKRMRTRHWPSRR